MNGENELKKTIYEQDCEFYRYQDNLMWSRFQTAAAIEAAVLSGVFFLGEQEQLERLGLMLFGLVLVLIVCGLSLKDHADAALHLDRLRKFEENAVEKLGPRKWSSLPSGKTLMLTAAGLLTLFNVVILVLIAVNAI